MPYGSSFRPHALGVGDEGAVGSEDRENRPWARGPLETFAHRSKFIKAFKTVCPPPLYQFLDRSLAMMTPAATGAFIHQMSPHRRTDATVHNTRPRRFSVTPTVATERTLESYFTAPESLRSWAFDADKNIPDWESALGVTYEHNADPSPVDFLSELPYEIVHMIFSYVDFESLKSCLQVSRKWRQLLAEPDTWKRLYMQEWGTDEQFDASTMGRPIDWESLYFGRTQIEVNWLATEVTVKALEGHVDSVYCVESDNRIVVTGSRDSTIKVWEMNTQKLVTTLDGHTGSVLCLSMDDSLLVSGSSDSTFIVWSRPNFKCIKKVSYHKMRVLDVVLLEHYIVTTSKDGCVAVWNRSDLSLLHAIEKAHAGPVNAIDGFDDQVFTAGGDGLVHRWDVKTGICLASYRGHTRGLACIKVDRRNRRFFTGSNDRTIRFWNMDSGECYMVLKGHQHLVRSIHVLPTKLISASYDRTIKVWDIETGHLLSDYCGWHGGWIFCVRACATSIISSSEGIKPVIIDFTNGVDDTVTSVINKI